MRSNENNKISILMSFYNESSDEIKKSIDSIIKQTYKNWELILICDNPKAIKKYEQLSMIYEKEKKIKIFMNEKNIGLALSMNRAAELASGNILARMDADDICMETRLEEEIGYLTSNNFDLVATEYLYIDEEDNIIDKDYKKYTNENIKKLLPYTNTIHHPTIMIKKQIFFEVGGYRDFPCSQDYDLWLRLYEKNISIGILQKPLIKYRIRSNSITQKNKLRQMLTLWYINECFYERKRMGVDKFSLENYEKYLKKQGFFDEKYVTSFNKAKRIKDKIDEYRGKKGKKFIRILIMFYLFCINNFYRREYFRIIKNKILIWSDKK